MSESRLQSEVSGAKTTSESTITWRTRLRKCAPAAALAVAMAGGTVAYREHQQTDKALQAQADQIAELKAQNDRTDRILSGNLGISKGVVTGKTLTSPDTLPGIAITVPPEVRATLQGATVKIGEGQIVESEDAAAWAGRCTATKVVSTTGKMYIMSAAHCFENGANEAKEGDQGPLAVNVAVRGNTYAVLDASLPLEKRSNAEPLALIGNIAVDRSGTTDIALAEVTPNPARAEAFNSIPAIPLNRYDVGTLDSLDSRFVPGQAVALDGLPASNNDEHVRTAGVYLGRYQTSEISNISNQLDLVATKTPVYEQDACNYGASGSQAAYLGTDGKLSATGPLSWRNTIGYGENRAFYSPDEAQVSIESRLKVEELTGFNLDAFDTICGYSTPQQDTLGNLERVLENPSLVILNQGGK